MEVIVRDLSYSGAKVSVFNFLESSGNVEIQLYFTEKPLRINGSITYKRKMKNESYSIGIIFKEMDLKTKKELLSFLFITTPHLLNKLISNRDLSLEEMLEAHLRSGVFNSFLE